MVRQSLQIRRNKSLGIHTSWKSTWVDAQVASGVQLIAEIILQNVPHVRSNLLTGGFGKRERSVKITEGEKDYLFKGF